uniref:CAPA-Periviscerokinin-1 n=1 Tax=Striatophasma naukluftense TaxID=1041429 RepID=PVK1_STRNA|nr:RecName: Full=CAPA-Periviscerokinin-1; Short=CAPA-PVK-1 [Striatophasma naukluftense]
EAAGLISFPRV